MAKGNLPEGITSVRRFIFIGGLHRSGTSLLHRALQAHPEISGFVNTISPENEGQHLQDIFSPAAAYGGPGKFGFAADACLNEHSPHVTLENRNRLLRQWGRYWDPEKAFVIEKSPPNLIRMRFLQAFFPNSLFLIIIRHPLAAGYSTRKWSATDIRELVCHWIITHQRMMDDLPFIRQWHLIRYEDLVEEPNEVLTEVHQRIGVEPAPFGEHVSKELNQGYLAQWEKDLCRNPAMAKSFRLLDEWPQKFGYHFEPPYTQPPSICFKTLRVSREGPMWNASRERRDAGNVFARQIAVEA